MSCFLSFCVCDGFKVSLVTRLLTGVCDRFGWVNASYIYGLQIVNAHMRRALGALTPYETFVRAIDENKAKALAELI